MENMTECKLVILRYTVRLLLHAIEQMLYAVKQQQPINESWFKLCARYKGVELAASELTKVVRGE